MYEAEYAAEPIILIHAVRNERQAYCTGSALLPDDPEMWPNVPRVKCRACEVLIGLEQSFPSGKEVPPWQTSMCPIST